MWCSNLCFSAEALYDDCIVTEDFAFNLKYMYLVLVLDHSQTVFINSFATILNVESELA